MLLISLLISACQTGTAESPTTVPTNTAQAVTATAPSPTATTPATSELPAPADQPKIHVDQPIRFAVGPLDLSQEGSVIRGERDRYTLSMLAGETLSVVISSLEGNASFSILGPDQNPLPGTEEYKETIQWSIIAAADGEYAILVAPTRGNATYTLKVQVSTP
jgi:hypothetical protein